MFAVIDLGDEISAGNRREWNEWDQLVVIEQQAAFIKSRRHQFFLKIKHQWDGERR